MQNIKILNQNIIFALKTKVGCPLLLLNLGNCYKKKYPVMLPTGSSHIPQSALYQKAMEIFTISRSISHYFVDDLNYLQKDGKEDPSIYFTGDIVQQSVSLAPEILRAESEVFSEGKQKYAASVTRLTNSLYKNCERLERSGSNGRDFLPVLRKELKKFRKLQRSWMLTL